MHTATEATTSYQNPILFADYSDPDAIRVGEDFWLIASSFCHVPGLPILHSKDLVNWELVNHALPKLVPEIHYTKHRAGCGVWAPALRHDDGKFWIFYPDPDFGIYVTTATDPRGEWSTPFLIKAGKGLIDPCPLWDGEKAYLVHGWAKSRAGICNILTLHEMTLDATTLLDEGTVIIDGNKDTNWNTIEGPKLYKRDGWYWVFAPADGVATGFQAVFRSRNIRGPYEGRNVLHQGKTEVNGPHQGAWIDTPSGENWFMHFQERQPFGRVVHLQPMIWREDGWPVMGSDPEESGTGEPVSTYPRPALPLTPGESPLRSDHFQNGTFARQWQWQSNPAPGWVVDNAGAEGLKLATAARQAPDSFWEHGAILMQKFTGPQFSAQVDLNYKATASGDAAGLIVLGYDYFWIGIVKSERGVQLEFRNCKDAEQGGTERLLESIVFDDQEEITLCLDADSSGKCQFSYSQANTSIIPFGPSFQARESKWVGAKIGIFASNLSAKPSPSIATFKNFLVS